MPVNSQEPTDNVLPTEYPGDVDLCRASTAAIIPRRRFSVEQFSADASVAVSLLGHLSDEQYHQTFGGASFTLTPTNAISGATDSSALPIVFDFLQNSWLLFAANTEPKLTELLKTRQIIKEALRRYRAPDGYEGDLVDAAWKVEQMGSGAWPALSELASEDIPEVEYFVGSIVRLKGVEPKARELVLQAIARNHDPNVRSRLLELLDEIHEESRRLILRTMAGIALLQDDVSERARCLLADDAS
jgi:hypothetical protein